MGVGWVRTIRMEGDSSAEMRSMMLVMHPCPPLPIVGAIVNGQAEHGDSHDSLAFCIDVVARRADEKENGLRKEAQTAWIAAYLHALRGATDVYDVMCDFTRLYIQSYFPRASMDIRFARIEDIHPKMQRSVCEWLAARQIVDLGKEDARAEDHYHKIPAQLYAECASLISGI